MYMLIVWLTNRWAPQYNNDMRNQNLNGAYIQKQDNDKTYNGAYVFEVVEVDTDLKALPAPNYTYGANR